MFIITLTSIADLQPVCINPHAIVAFHPDADDTVIKLCDGIGYTVQETPEQIVALIEQGQRADDGRHNEFLVSFEKWRRQYEPGREVWTASTQP